MCNTSSFRETPSLSQVPKVEAFSYKEPPNYLAQAWFELNGTFHLCPKPTAIHTEWNTVVGHTPNTRVSLNHMDLHGGGVRSATKEDATGTGQA